MGLEETATATSVYILRSDRRLWTSSFSFFQVRECNLGPSSLILTMLLCLPHFSSHPLPHVELDEMGVWLQAGVEREKMHPNWTIAPPPTIITKPQPLWYVCRCIHMCVHTCIHTHIYIVRGVSHGILSLLWCSPTHSHTHIFQIKREKRTTYVTFIQLFSFLGFKLFSSFLIFQ